MKPQPIDQTIKKNKEWTEAVVLEEIKKWHEAGKPLFSHYMRKHYQELLAAAVRYFGNWGKAVEAAGLSYDEIRRYKAWSKEKIIQMIQQLYRQGTDLSFRSMMLGEYAPMVYAAIRPNYFGSWKNALLAAGLAPQDIYRYKSWKNENILEEIRRLYKEGADLSSKQMEKNASSLIAIARRRFGSWSSAIEQAGLDYDKIRNRKRWSKEQIIQGIRSLKEKGISLTSTKVREVNPALFAAACKKRFFGSWKKAVENALS
ncbi:hypothetical protein A7K93_01640 [Candidatus Methylacidiphilum fumarolicum]|uniref:Uncharacterized protein n=2 Tax=Candidatus Methylacidiphilum fumarolicum TaxID=591154 RepID=I0JVT2_METFB|nr:hypothetical protein [Candidatus Methylacidiphilum fumarolicum]MBW6414099.1 hypothetical protein [Candidatus Methylacidiphilum fumarolicum]TFE66448.1 hypothetical protein A7K73_01690 [Candidatus Methylacidiphilum fumarolicum]TFE75214.1 hypothetical protein A7K93_01640 [Candidatus Methylacidiphilum fumarolicum]TFE76174.1 hypothetical protein A7K72_00535 [Candidatus Methylacidiphilum fumarolicum]TFE77321.1 hypothetical protein A7D33_05805 [Candidatus Methylacidiphilum fumarolicum]